MTIKNKKQQTKNKKNKRLKIPPIYSSDSYLCGELILTIAEFYVKIFQLTKLEN